MRIKLLSLLILLSATLAVTAQKNGAKKPVTQQKIKPPKLFTFLNDLKDSVGVRAGDAEGIVGMPLHITDAQKNIYTISSYQFLYRKNAVTEDEATGKISNTTSMLASRFRTTPLPEAWINKVREELRPGELLQFFDVIVMDKAGRLMYAPDLKITIL